ncbi:prolactin-releasing peptide receptor-like [Ptychodera flava]|uniref:prolactin-releasing peptide receptor-like n=1 Tax=Ptychodera flava TaxID=63121 RepID=UPI00396A2239
METPVASGYGGVYLNMSYPNVTTTENPFAGFQAGKEMVRKVAWFIIILYSVVFIIGTVGNALIVITVAWHKSMQNVTNYFIANLAASDFAMCIFCIPWTLAQTLMDDWIFGEVLCRLVPTIQAVSVFVSITSHIVIACDRYCLIMYPLRPRLPRLFCVAIILLSWVMAVGLAVPILYYTRPYDLRALGYHIICYEHWPDMEAQRAYNYVLLLVGYVLPLILIVILYSRISYLLTRRVLPGVFTEDQERRDLKKKQKTNRLLIAVVLTFAICWFPFYTVHAIVNINPRVFGRERFDLIYTMCHWFAMSSTVYNPFVYAWLHEKYRHQLKSVFTVSCMRQSSLYRSNSRGPATQLQTREFYSTNSPRSTRFSSVRSSKGQEVV